jgi:lipooligosaccharide transport system ATP-binding protein
MNKERGNPKGKSRVQYVIEAEDVRKVFDGFAAVDGISFSVYPGECFGILGPNGAGKTSTIRMIYGFSPITSGSLKVFGLDISRRWREIRTRIGVCQQENSLDMDLTVLGNLETFARYFNIPKKEARAKALSLLEFIALDHRKNEEVVDLSGGLKRRLVLARALINNPDLLILDEPTTGLDPQSRHQVWARLEDLRAGGISILLTTHYMDEASRLCDRLIIMDHGRILVEGRPADLIQEKIGHSIIEIDNPGPDLRVSVQKQRLEYEDTGHRLIIYSWSREDSSRLFHEMCDHFPHERCILRMATLEDLFLKLTGRELRE